ncbi:hypothetical protein BDD12DRAFT_869618 [Trichophaea hybrida]|nr:hypothetical protein BDD12DRAFT_869618 [Trichophaea hybrida]
MIELKNGYGEMMGCVLVSEGGKGWCGYTRSIQKDVHELSLDGDGLEGCGGRKELCVCAGGGTRYLLFTPLRGILKTDLQHHSRLAGLSQRWISLELNLTDSLAFLANKQIRTTQHPRRGGHLASTASGFHFQGGVPPPDFIQGMEDILAAIDVLV